MISLQCKAKRRTTLCILHNYCTITFGDIEHFLSATMSDLYLLTAYVTSRGKSIAVCMVDWHQENRRLLILCWHTSKLTVAPTDSHHCRRQLFGSLSPNYICAWLSVLTGSWKSNNSLEALHHVSSYISLRTKVPADELILNLLVNISTLCIIPSMTVELQVPEDLANSLCKRKSWCTVVWTKGKKQTRMHKQSDNSGNRNHDVVTVWTSPKWRTMFTLSRKCRTAPRDFTGKCCQHAWACCTSRSDSPVHMGIHWQAEW